MVELDDSYTDLKYKTSCPVLQAFEDDLHKTLEQMKEDHCNNQA